MCLHIHKIHNKGNHTDTSMSSAVNSKWPNIQLGLCEAIVAGNLDNLAKHGHVASFNTGSYMYNVELSEFQVGREQFGFVWLDLVFTM